MKRLLAFLLAILVTFPLSSCSKKQTHPTATSYRYSTSKPTATPFDVVAYYQKNYPMVWGYIRKNASNPASYIKYYHQVWGDLQSYTGDGINFDTLTRYEQSLVNYPRIGSYVYFSSAKSKEYHSTSMCYSLLKSKPVSRPASQRYNYDPCSKCVGD